MRIAMDFSAVRRPGAENYCRNFLRHLPQYAADDEVLLFLPPRMAKEHEGRLPANVTVRVTRVTANVVLRVLWQQLALPWHLRRWHADVLYEPFDLAPLRAPCPVCLQTVNPTPIADLSGYGIAVRFMARVQKQLSLFASQRAPVVCYPSQYAADTLGPRLGVPPERRVVVYHGLDFGWWAQPSPLEPVARKHELPQAPYLLFASQMYRQKHPDTLLQAFAQLVQQPYHHDYHLVLAGAAPEAQFDEELHRLSQVLGVTDRVHFLGQLPAEDLRTLYQHAAVFVLPSSMETFGHPYVEAMAAGTPVLAADTPVAREICADAACFFPVGDTESLAALLLAVLKSDNGRSALIARGKARAETFGWEQVVWRTVQIIRGAASRCEDDKASNCRAKWSQWPSTDGEG